MVEYRSAAFIRVLVGVNSVLLVGNGLALLQTGSLAALFGVVVTAAVLAALLFRWQHVRTVVKFWAVLLMLGGVLSVLGAVLVIVGVLMGGQATNLSATLLQALVSGVLLALGVFVYRSADRQIVAAPSPPAS